MDEALGWTPLQPAAPRPFCPGNATASDIVLLCTLPWEKKQVSVSLGMIRIFLKEIYVSKQDKRLLKMHLMRRSGWNSELRCLHGCWCTGRSAPQQPTKETSPSTAAVLTGKGELSADVAVTPATKNHIRTVNQGVYGRCGDAGLLWAQGCPLNHPLMGTEVLTETCSTACGYSVHPAGNCLDAREYHPLIFFYQCLLFQYIRAEIFKAAWGFGELDSKCSRQFWKFLREWFYNAMSLILQSLLV